MTPSENTFPIYVADAFTGPNALGNPAAIAFPQRELTTEEMSDTAQEMNLSETAFLTPQDDGFGLRWFTPEYEVQLCGHATLAAALTIWATGRFPPDAAISFQTLSGRLVVNALTDGSLRMDFPRRNPESLVETPTGLTEALGAQGVVEWVGADADDLFVEVDSESSLRKLNPDFGLLATIKTRGVIVTARSDDGAYDFVSRFFAPDAGIPEDPVTGSAHCALAPFWAERLGRNELTGFQASKRGGVVRVSLNEERVSLIGHGRIRVHGEFTL